TAASIFTLYGYPPHCDLHSFPTRRSSDLISSGVKDVRRVMEQALDNRDLYGRTTILFLDEIHRFNKAQQDALLKRWISSRNKIRSEEHTSELQSRFDLVCRLLLEKKKT